MELLDQTFTLTVTFLQLSIYLTIGLFLDWVTAVANRKMARDSNDPNYHTHGITATIMIVPAWPFAILGIILTGIFGRDD